MPADPSLQAGIVPYSVRMFVSVGMFVCGHVCNIILARPGVHEQFSRGESFVVL